MTAFIFFKGTIQFINAGALFYKLNSAYFISFFLYAFVNKTISLNKIKWAIIFFIVLPILIDPFCDYDPYKLICMDD